MALDVNTIDLEGNGSSLNSNANGEDVQNLDGHSDDINNQNNQNNNNGGEGSDNNNGGGSGDNQNNNGDNGGQEGNQGDNGGSSTGELEVGDTVEYDGATYTVAENGDLVDADGKVFKAANEVKDFLATVEVDENNEDEINISSLQEALGVTIEDEEGKPVEFTNDAAGVKSYVNSVIDLKSKELREGAINKLFADNPLLKQFNDYVTVNGSYQGFGELPDRSGITIDKDNETQQIAIIKMAAKEFGNATLNDTYINYLKDNGALYNEAKTQLEALQAKDEQVRAQYAEQANAVRNAQLEDLNNYWRKVNDVINSRNVGGYQIPESFTKEVNGTKVVLTTNDFYKYISKPTETSADGNKVTAYQRDLAKLTDEEYMNREILDAWLMFTGGSYKDLIDMKVNEENVKKLRLKAKENRSVKSVKVVKKASGKTDINNIVLS